MRQSADCFILNSINACVAESKAQGHAEEQDASSEYSDDFDESSESEIEEGVWWLFPVNCFGAETLFESFISQSLHWKLHSFIDHLTFQCFVSSVSILAIIVTLWSFRRVWNLHECEILGYKKCGNFENNTKRAGFCLSVWVCFCADVHHVGCGLSNKQTENLP